jgi:hypothetical protein
VLELQVLREAWEAVVNATLKDLEDELARLQAKQSNLTDPAQAQQRREAAQRRQALEQSNERKLAAIEPVRRQAEQLQRKVDALELASARASSEEEQRQQSQRLRSLRVELANTLKQLAAMVERAKIEIAASQPKIEWCRQIEAGLAPDSDRDVEAGMAELDLEVQP